MKWGFKMRKIEKLNVAFKKDLSNIELFGIERILEKLHQNYIDDDTIFEEGELLFIPCELEKYGLAYTSTSGYAMYNVTNAIDFGYDSSDFAITLSHFAITENDMLVAVCSNIYENTVLFEVEISDL